MTEHPETERRVADALTTRSAALQSPSPDLDGVWQRLDRRRRRRRGVAILGSVAVVGAGAVGLLSLRTDDSEPTIAADAAGGTPDQQAAWRCTDQLDVFEEGSPALFFATCDQVAIDGSVPIIGDFPHPTIAVDPSQIITTTTTVVIEQVWHTVREGDTLEALTAEFGTTPDDIAGLNGWPDASGERLHPGDRILILLQPPPTTAWAGDADVTDSTVPLDRSPSEQDYVIRAGDSLASIAERFGITLEQLVNYNEFPDGASHLILPGDVIVIPPDALAPDTGVPATTTTTSTSVP